MDEYEYIDWNYNTGVVKRYIRSGKCNNCGDCCTAYIRLAVRGRWDNDGKNGGEYTSQKSIWHEINTPDRRTFYRIKKIIPNEKACGSLENCKCISNGSKPKICSFWPLSPIYANLFPNCGYEFTLDHEWEMDAKV